MPDILTITLNPAVDMSTATDCLKPGQKLRCDAPSSDPGGGGINVSRVIATLGGHSRALVAMGGLAGQALKTLLEEEDLDVLPFHAPGNTRASFAVRDRSTGQQYRFVLPGPQWGETRLADVLRLSAEAAPIGGYVVLSGSLPPGIPDDFPLHLARAIAPRRAELIADISGAALATLCARPAKIAADPIALLRMNRSEARSVAGRPLAKREDSAGFASALVHKGVAKLVVVARGADGSVLATPDGCFHCTPPEVEVVSKIGAGDSFVGAFTLALAHGLPPQEALRRGTAASSAAVLTEATELCTRADADRLLPLCRVEPLMAQTA